MTRQQIANLSPADRINGYLARVNDLANAPQDAINRLVAELAEWRQALSREEMDQARQMTESR